MGYARYCILDKISQKNLVKRWELGKVESWTVRQLGSWTANLERYP
ncbi:MAG: hypothetical protein ACOCG5_08780 [Candidatus Alkaliphilus sp. MAG34]|jgi:hypothetical protein